MIHIKAKIKWHLTMTLILRYFNLKIIGELKKYIFIYLQNNEKN